MTPADLAALNDELDRTTGALPTAGNQVEPFIDGERALPALLASLDAARTSIDYQTFLFAPAELTAERVADALLAAHRRGVAVRLLVDAIGSGVYLHKRNPTVERLARAGLAVRLFDPLDSLRDLALHRDHRKLVVVDGAEAWLGGMNTGDLFLGGPEVPGRVHDVFARLRGPAVSDVHRSALAGWLAAGGPAFPLPPPPEPAGESRVRVVTHLPGDARLRTTYLALARRARRRLLVENAFPMASDLVRALAEAARRGVEVRYLVGSGAEPVYAVARKNFPALVAAGVQVHVHPGGVHTKAISVDGQICALGSGNVDRVSLERNWELCAVVEDPAFVARFERDLFEADLAVAPDLSARPAARALARLRDALLARAWPDALE